MFLAEESSETGSGIKEPCPCSNLTKKMKEYEKVTDAEMQTIGCVGGSLLTILGVVAVILVLVLSYVWSFYQEFRSIMQYYGQS